MTHPPRETDDRDADAPEGDGREEVTARGGAGSADDEDGAGADADVDVEGEGEEEEPGGDDDDPVARPLPGFETYDPIFGGFRGVSPTRTTHPGAGMALDEEVGEVLLEVEGEGAGIGALMAVGLLFPGVLLVPILATVAGYRLAPRLPWAEPWAFTLFGLLVAVVSVALAWGRLVRLFYDAGRVTFTERGVLRRRAGAAEWVPRDELRGYRLGERTYVLLEVEGGQLGVPTPDEAARERVVELLDGWGVARLD